MRLVLSQPLEDGSVQGSRVCTAIGRGQCRISEPGVRQCLTRAEPSLGILLQEAPAEIAGVLRDALKLLPQQPYRSPGFDLRMHRLGVVNLGVKERVPACEQLGEDDSNAEHVCLLVVHSGYDHLWRHVIRRARTLHHLPLHLAPPGRGRRWQHPGEAAQGVAPGDTHLPGSLTEPFRVARQAEIDKHQRRTRTGIQEEDVVGFHVPVDDAPVVAVHDGGEYLPHHVGDVALHHGHPERLVVVPDPEE
mmetsp:Transcript_1447/g.3296  ORF Transcript_1447/g.3296 Transcript_1447/m.3296 type:complete len:248 (-) Transcript_1447:747-1490(-)